MSLYKVDPQQRSPRLRGQREKGWGSLGARLLRSHLGRYMEPNRVTWFTAVNRQEMLACPSWLLGNPWLAMEIPTRGLPAKLSAQHQHSPRSPHTLHSSPYVRGWSLWTSGIIYSHLNPSIRAIWIWKMARRGTGDWWRGWFFYSLSGGLNAELHTDLPVSE